MGGGGGSASHVKRSSESRAHEAAPGGHPSPGSFCRSAVFPVQGAAFISMTARWKQHFQETGPHSRDEEGQRAKGQRQRIRRVVSFKEHFLKAHPASSVYLSSLGHP